MAFDDLATAIGLLIAIIGFSEYRFRQIQNELRTEVTIAKKQHRTIYKQLKQIHNRICPRRNNNRYY